MSLSHMRPFAILKQQDPARGCIPACAASVLRYHGVSKPDWSESGILAMYSRPANTGFDTLKGYLDAQPEMTGWEVVIDKSSNTTDLKTLATSVVSQYGPTLIPITGDPAHCAVIIEPDHSGVIVCDPSPNLPNRQRMPWDQLKRIWLGGLLYVRKKKRVNSLSPNKITGRAEKGPE